MQQFWTDVIAQISSYYHQLVVILPKLCVAILLLVVSWLLGNILKRTFRRWISPKLDDPLLAAFFARLVKITIVLIGILSALGVVGLGEAAAGLLAGAGLSAFIIGFAFKDIGENFLAGVIMAFDRPFRIGDVVALQGQEGKVIGLTLRDTHIKTFDGKDVFIPNGSIVKNPITNYTIDGFLRDTFSFTLPYEADLGHALRLVREALEGIPGVLSEGRAPNVVLSSMKDSEVTLTAYYWMNTEDTRYSGQVMKTEAIQQIVVAMQVAGFPAPAELVELKRNIGESA
ncbi:MAG: mechanosensitive ion channel family protein [Lewinella sp.]|nr:mechanosensitive ion channel family protein [Lewinella sp.]